MKRAMLTVGLLAVGTIAEAREWTIRGAKVEAEYLGLKDGKVALKLPDGRTGQIPLESLSADDQQFARSQSEQGGGVLKQVQKQFATPKPVQVDLSGDDRFTQEIKKNPNNPGPYVVRAMTRTTQGKYDEAQADLQKAMELEPGNAEALNARGKLNAKKGDYKQAHEDFSAAIDKNPDFAMAYRNRGDNLKSLLNSKQGEKMLDEMKERYRKKFSQIQAHHDKNTPWQPLNHTTGPVTGSSMALSLAKMDYKFAEDIELRLRPKLDVDVGVSAGYHIGLGGHAGVAAGQAHGDCKFCLGKGCESCNGGPMNPPLAVHPNVVTQGEYVTLVANPSELKKGMPQKVGPDGKPLATKAPPGAKKFKPEPVKQDVELVDFYRDVDGDGEFNREKDEYLATDQESSDGYSVKVSTEKFNPGQQAYFAVPKGKGGEGAAASAGSFTLKEDLLRTLAKAERNIAKNAGEAAHQSGLVNDSANKMMGEQNDVSKQVFELARTLKDTAPEAAALLDEAKKAIGATTTQLRQAQKNPGEPSKTPSSMASSEATAAAVQLEKAADILAKLSGNDKPKSGEAGQGSGQGSAPGQGGAGQGAPAQGAPGSGQPGQGQPAQGQPGQGQPSQGQPAKAGPPTGEQYAGQPGKATGEIKPAPQGAPGGPGGPGGGPGGPGGGGDGRGGDDDNATVNNYYGDRYDRDADSDVVVDRARDYAATGDYDSAIVGYDHVLRDDPTNVTYLRDRAGAYLERGSYDMAIRDYNRAIGLTAPSVKTVDFYYNRGCAYMASGRLDEAIDDFTTSIGLDELQKLGNRAYTNRGTCWARKSDYVKAIENFNDAIRITPDDHLAYHNRALAWKKQGDVEKALADLRKSKELQQAKEAADAAKSQQAAAAPTP